MYHDVDMDSKRRETKVSRLGALLRVAFVSEGERNLATCGRDLSLVGSEAGN